MCLCTRVQIFTQHARLKDAFSELHPGVFEPTYGVVGTPLAPHQRPDVPGGLCLFDSRRSLQYLTASRDVTWSFRFAASNRSNCKHERST